MAGDLEQKIQKVLRQTTQEVSGIRSGRANPGLLENVPVEQYGTVLPLKQLASISVPEARTLAVSPWDKQALDAVMKALKREDLGVMPTVHGEIIHVVLPSMTSERREQLMKILGKVIEEGKVALRREREGEIEELKKRKASGEISEDDFFRKREGIDERVRRAAESLEELREKKREELEAV